MTKTLLLMGQQICYVAVYACAALFYAACRRSRRFFENVQLKQEPIPGSGFLVKLAQHGGTWQRVSGDPHGLRIAVNKSFTELSTLVGQSDRVAFVASRRLA